MKNRDLQRLSKGCGAEQFRGRSGKQNCKNVNRKRRSEVLAQFAGPAFQSRMAQMKLRRESLNSNMSWNRTVESEPLESEKLPEPTASP